MLAPLQQPQPIVGSSFFVLSYSYAVQQDLVEFRVFTSLA